MDNENLEQKEKLPQNIQSLIGEIGEKQVLLRLFFLTQGTEWQVFQNLGEAGYDILLFKNSTNQRIQIEVKARQKIYSTGKHLNTIHFDMSDGEYKACDYLIAYNLTENQFYIVPKIILRSVSSNGKKRWRFTLRFNKQGQLPEEISHYQGAWHNLHTDFAGRDDLVTGK